MSEYETGSVARLYCPGCEPDADPTAEILDVRWCTEHTPSWAGAEDPGTAVYITNSSEVGGEDNRLWCALVHRKRLVMVRP